MIKILMIEDDEEFAYLLERFLKQYSMEVTTYSDPYMGLSADIGTYDLLILDLTLPGMDGLDVCREVVARYDIPIIISSARSDLGDKIVGLQIGADDYLPKPYDPQEMYARIVSLLRRYKKINSLSNEKTSKIDLDHVHEQFIVAGNAVDLTPAEFIIAKVLFANIGTTVSKEQILYESVLLEESSDSSLSVLVSRLRKKMGEFATIKTVRGMGYRLIV